MTTTLAGENSFSLSQELRKLVAEFVAEQGDLGLERIDCEDAEFSKIQEALTSLPFLTTKKLVVLRAPSKNKQFVEAAEQIFGAVPETTEVIIVETKLDKRQSYYKFLKSKTNFRAFEEVDAQNMAEWLSATAKERGGSLSANDARYLTERIGAKQQLLSNELEKLLLYEPKVTRQTIDLLTDETPQSTVFQLLEAAFAGNSKLAMRLYTEQRALKVEPQQIIAMIVWQLHVVAILKVADERSVDEIAGDSRINPYVIRKSQTIARNLTLAQLKSLISDLLSIDVRSKSVSIDLDEALQHYLLSLSLA